MKKEDASKLIGSYNALVTPDEALLLYNSAKKYCGLGPIVEIGSHNGGSTILMAKACQEISNGTIYAIDCFMVLDEKETGAFMSNIKKSGARPYIVPIKKSSYGASKKWNKKISMLFVDGRHDYNFVKMDFLRYEKFLERGGAILFHDSVYTEKDISLEKEGNRKDILGSKRIVKQYILNSKRFSNIKTTDSITCAIKISDRSFLDSFKYSIDSIRALPEIMLFEIDCMLRNANYELGKIGIYIKKNNPKIYSALKKTEKFMRDGSLQLNGSAGEKKKFDTEIKKYKYIIPLGYNCVLSTQLNKNYLRKVAYPFDWCKTPFEALCSILENNFAHFFDEISIDPQKTVFTYKKGQKEMEATSQIYKNNVFTHEWEIVYDKKNGLQEIKNKYERRIKRFYSTVNSREPVLFIRFIQKSDKENTAKLNNLLNRKFPDLKYFLILIKEKGGGDELNKLCPAEPNTQMYYIDMPKKDDYYCDAKYDLKWSVLFLKMGIINRREFMYIKITRINKKIDKFVGKLGLFLKDKSPKLYYLLKRLK